MASLIDKQCRVVLVGKTGCGKSSLGNSLLQVKRAFKSSSSGKSVTDRCHLKQSCIHERGLILTVIDTPGLFDTEDPDKKTTTEIVKSIALAAPGPHVFLFVLSVVRFTKEEREVFEILKKLFGEKAKNHTIVVFTVTDKFDDDGDDDDDIHDVHDFLENSHEDLQMFVKNCNNRYAGICNRTDNPNHQRDVNNLLDLIMKTIEENGNTYFSQEAFEKAEEVIEKEVKNREQTEPSKPPETHRKEVLHEIESKTEDSEKIGVWGEAGAAVYNTIKTVLSVPSDLFTWAFG